MVIKSPPEGGVDLSLGLEKDTTGEVVRPDAQRVIDPDHSRVPKHCLRFLPKEKGNGRIQCFESFQYISFRNIVAEHQLHFQTPRRMLYRDIDITETHLDVLQELLGCHDVFTDLLLDVLEEMVRDIPHLVQAIERAVLPFCQPDFVEDIIQVFRVVSIHFVQEHRR